ncbi:MAG: hypothetical protein KF784_15370 [Fimbriimonadaceae bacterium]|nr:hypothetical protein [Fimbriimonadaceae bacterium]
MSPRIPFACLAILLASITLAGGQDTRRLDAVKVVNPPKIDGIIEDSEWANLSTFQGLLDEETGQPTDETAQFWIGYDDKFIYFAAKLVDKQPHTIQATEYRTNVSLGGDDSVTFALDPFNTYRDFNHFSINPRGATNIDIAGGRAAKREWLGEILANARVTETGWEAEARIPWGIMRLPSQGMHDMAFNASRNHKRLQRDFVWAHTGDGRVENNGRWVGVDVPATDRNSLKLLPFGYLGYDDGKTISNAGLDARMAITDQLEAVGSINPDFRNIENQVLSIDFSYFERLAGESRPFFLEGSSFFGTSRDAPIFASQRIDKFDTGLKFYGKINPTTDIGIINANDFGDENALVGRANMQFSPRSNLVVAFTDLQRKGISNSADFISYSHGIDRLSLFGQISTSRDTDEGDGHRYNTGLSYRNQGLSSSLEYVEISPNYRPRLGFVRERNLRGYNGRFSFDKPMDWNGVIEAGYSLGFEKLNDFDGNPYRTEFSASTSVTMKDGLDIDIDYDYEEFEGNIDRVFDFSIEKPRGNPYRRWDFGFTTGKVAGENYQSERISISYRPVQRLQLNGRLQHVKFGSEDNSQFILSGVYDIGNDQSINGRLVSRGSDTNVYLAFRRSGNKGAEYFFILGDPNARSFRMSVTLKVSVPFEIR